MFKKLFEFIHWLKYNTHPARMETKARKAVVFGSNKAFKIFKDEKFRKLLKFNKLEPVERDRIFNELTVTNLILLMLLLDQLIREIIEDDKKEYFKALRQAVPEYFKGFIKRIGIPAKFAKIWHQLIDLRYDEYNQRVFETRKSFLEDENLSDLAEYKNVVIFQAIAFGLYDHLMRGKVKPGDPIYKFIQPYLSFVYKGYLKRI